MGSTFPVITPGSYVIKGEQSNKPLLADLTRVAHQTVHCFPGGAEAVAKAMGVHKGTLLHKLNPANTTHKLSLDEAVQIQLVTGNLALLQTVAGLLGHTAVSDARRFDVLTPSEALTNLAVVFGQLLQALADPIHRAAAEGAGPLEAVSLSEENRANFHAVNMYQAVSDAMALMRALRRPQPGKGDV